MAYEISEECYDDKEIFLVGIQPNGFEFAKLLKKEIEKIGLSKVHLHSLTINKAEPKLQSITTDFSSFDVLKNKTLILADDVGNTGKTMYHALQIFSDVSFKKVKTTVLVERQHKNYPIASDFVGLSLSTTMQEHILVEFKNGKGAAFLE